MADARVTLVSCLALNGVASASGNGTLVPRSRSMPRPDANQVLAYIRKNPGSGSQDICGELGSSAATLRPVLHALRDAGKVKVSGQARSTRYTAKK